MSKFFNVGHRGAAAYRHENTLESMEEGIARHADMLEFDVRETSDRVLVLYHNRTIKTEKGINRAISDLTLDELRRIALSRNFDLALFEDVLRNYGKRIPLNIEIKAGGYEAALISMLKKYPPGYEPTLSSFFPWVIRRIKQIDRRCRTALIVGQERVVQLNVLALPVIEKLVESLGISAIHLQETLATADLVNKLGRMGIMVFVWTVDDPARIRRLLRIGVDGIITNRPDVLYQTCLEMSDAREPILRKTRNSFGKFSYAI